MAKKQIVIEEAKPTNDAYTGMLAISLISLIVGCVMLYLDYNQYGPEPPPPIPTAAAVQPATPPAQQPPAQPANPDPMAPAPMLPAPQ